MEKRNKMVAKTNLGTIFLQKALEDLVFDKDMTDKFTGVFLQAAEIEQENIKNAYNKGKQDSVHLNEHTAEDYITKTFN